MKKVPVSLAVAVLLSACSVTPEAIQTKDFLLQAKEDAARIRDGVEEVRDLTLDEALARALKYNLDRRVKMMEEALALSQLDMSKLDMLPRLALQAGYYSRDNDRISRSRTPEGLPSSSTFISSDKNHETQDLTFSWSLLDFGLGYYNSQQQADRVLIAAEKRRKAMHILMQDVRTAFWRSVSAQKLQAHVRQITKEAEDALADSRKAESERIRGPLDSLRYQRQILENLRLLEAIDQELSAAQVELSALINAPVGQKMKLVEPNVKPEVKALDIDVDQMEEMALSENPDLREQNYNFRIASVETRKTLLRLFPNLTLNYGPKFDSDSYQVNNRWSEAGVQISYNLTNIFTLDIQKKLAEAGVSLADQRRMAVQMAVVTQVHLARQQFSNSLSQLNRAEDIWKTDERIAELMVKREAAQVQSKLDRVSNQTAAVLSMLRRYQAVSAVYAAEARLNATLGVEPRVDNVMALDLPSLSKVVARGGSVSAAHQLKMTLAKMQDEVRLSDAILSASELALKNSQEALKGAEDRLKLAQEELDKARQAEAKALDKAADAARRKSEVEEDMAQKLVKAQADVQSASDQRVLSQALLDQKTAEVSSLTQARDKAAEESLVAKQAYKDAETKAEQDWVQAKETVNVADKAVDDQKAIVRGAEKQVDRSTSDSEQAQKQLRDAQQKVKSALETQAKLKQKALELESSKVKRGELDVKLAQLTQTLGDAQTEKTNLEQLYKSAVQAQDAAQAKADEDVKLARQALQDAKSARDDAVAVARSAQKAFEQNKADATAQAQKVKSATDFQAKLKQRSLELESSKAKRSDLDGKLSQLAQTLSDAQAERMKLEQQYKSAVQAQDAADAKADEDVKIARQALRDARTARDFAVAAARDAQRGFDQNKSDVAAEKLLQDANAAAQQAQANVVAKDQAIEEAKAAGKAAYQASKEAAKQANARLDAQNDKVKQLTRDSDRMKRELEDLGSQIAKQERDLEKDAAANAQELQSAQNLEAALKQKVASHTEDANAAAQQAQADVASKEQALDQFRANGKAAYQGAKEATKQADAKLNAQSDKVKQLTRDMDRNKRDLDDLSSQITKQERELEKDMSVNAQEVQAAQNQEAALQQQVVAQVSVTEASRANLVSSRAALDEAQKNLVNAKVVRDTSKEQGNSSVLTAKQVMQVAQARLDDAEKLLRNAQGELREAQRSDERAVELSSRTHEKLQLVEFEANGRIEKAEAAKAPHDAKAQEANQLLQAAALAHESANATLNQAAQLRERRIQELEQAKRRNQAAIDSLENAPKSVEEIWSKDMSQPVFAAFLKIKQEVEAMK